MITNRSPDMVTHSGVWIHYDDLENLDVRIDDIRYATANICRYVGHLKWMLIQHLALCAVLAHHHLREGSVKSPLVPGYAAIHDFHEVYVADMPAGLKKYIQDYCKIEDKAEIRVHEVFGLPINLRPKDEVKFIDLRALVCEMYLLDHKAQTRCAELYGGVPTEAEMKIIITISKLSNNACWDCITGHLNRTYRTINNLPTDSLEY